MHLLTPFPLRCVRPGCRDAPFMSINCSKRSSSSERKGLFILDAIVGVSRTELATRNISRSSRDAKNNVLESLLGCDSGREIGHSTVASAFGPPSL